MGTFIAFMSKRGLSLASVILAKTKNRAKKNSSLENSLCTVQTA